jgi:membrane protein implicated in regulation of membrane protease activity
MVDYLIANMWQVWAVLTVVCLILELSAGDFFIICFAIGALFAALVAPISNVFVQLGVFVVFSAMSIFLVRPFALRYLHKDERPHPSNADALMGREGRVSETIVAGGFGRVAIDGDDWKAVSTHPDEIPIGTPVRVIGRESIILTVEKI